MKNKLIIIGFIIGVIVGLRSHVSLGNIVTASLLFGVLTFVALLIDGLWQRRREICAILRSRRRRRC